GGVACTEHQMVLRADDIVRDDAVEVAGAEAVRRFLGLDAHP
ncbi:N-acetyltransferase, partial [Burkholderia multivorans]